MLHRIHSLLVVAALALLVAPASAAAVAVVPSNSTTPAPAPGFQLDLARRFSSTVAQLREKRSPSKTSKVGLAGARKRTFSDELLDMIKGVSNAFAGAASSSASASPRPHALAGKPSPSASWASHAAIQRRSNVPAASPTSGPSQSAHKPGASQSAHKPGASQSAHKPGASQSAHKPGASQSAHKPGAPQAAGASQSAHHPGPSPSHSAGAQSPGASQHAAAAAQPSALYDSRGKAERVWDLVRRAIQEEPWETLDSRLLCPVGETACPIFPRMGTYECLDTRVELESCGGCTSKGFGEDCTAIRGAQGVTCESGACHVYTCQPGFALDASYRREAGGKGRCRKVRAAQHEVEAEVEAEVAAPAAAWAQLEPRDKGVAAAAAAVEAQ
ncbi:protein priA [Rhodotorula diobovata]|uniref:Protein priA n=1 Tax=Rhodotorula diobovata TaxID=5288 RepID=A0A5C5FMV0_9BASI|nr:protein priA [Rhodotorula diobovata]